MSPIKRDYFVPDFGVDADILSSNKHTVDAESRLSHQWIPKKDEDDDTKWVVPSYTPDFKLSASDDSFLNKIHG